MKSEVIVWPKNQIRPFSMWFYIVMTSHQTKTNRVDFCWASATEMHIDTDDNDESIEILDENGNVYRHIPCLLFIFYFHFALLTYLFIIVWLLPYSTLV